MVPRPADRRIDRIAADGIAVGVVAASSRIFKLELEVMHELSPLRLRCDAGIYVCAPDCSVSLGTRLLVAEDRRGVGVVVVEVDVKVVTRDILLRVALNTGIAAASLPLVFSPYLLARAELGFAVEHRVLTSIAAVVAPVSAALRNVGVFDVRDDRLRVVDQVGVARRGE